MGTTNAGSGTRIDEIAASIYRISTPVPPTVVPGGFTFNQFLILDEQPLLFHTGPRQMFPLVREAMASVMSPAKLRWVAYSHWEPDESGALNEWLETAPQAVAVQGNVGVNVCANDQALRPPRALADGEVLSLGERQVRWIDTPHLPHGWDCGFLFEVKTRTLLAGDLFTQGGKDVAPIVETDILGPSEAFRGDGRLLLPHQECCDVDGEARALRADDAGLHARVLVAWRWREAPARTRESARRLTSRTSCRWPARGIEHRARGPSRGPAS